MTILENLWYGNIRPVEAFVEGNTELRLVSKNRENFEATLSPEQAELFEKYCTAVNEMNSVSETAAFKFGFNLAVWLIIESSQ